MKTKAKPSSLQAASSQFQHHSLVPKFSAFSPEQPAGSCTEGIVSTEISLKLLTLSQIFPLNMWAFYSLEWKVPSAWAPYGTSPSLLTLACAASAVCHIFSLPLGSELCSAFSYPGFPCGKS